MNKAKCNANQSKNLDRHGKRRVSASVLAIGLAAGLAGAADAPWDADFDGDGVVEAGQASQVTLRVANHGQASLDARVEWTLWRNPQGRDPEAVGDTAGLGERYATGTHELSVAPGATEEITPVAEQALDAGAFLLVSDVSAGERNAHRVHALYVMPPIIDPMPEDSQFGVNGSSFDFPDINRRLGVKWMRFENLKWQMAMPEPDRYAFDGSVAPWRVNMDAYLRMHEERDIEVLPYTFQTPRWLSRAPEGTERNVAGHPPQDFDSYGDIMFQIAARYGARKHPPEAIKSNDGVSGLGLLTHYQLWNEPNLVGPTWAPWVGSMPEFFEIFRIGAEAVKRADPEALVVPAAMAGIGLQTVDLLRSYTYADGKSPLDFSDVIAVNYYSGRQDPEVATIDRNATRSGEPAPGARPYPELITDLVDWRDDFAPGREIWIAETGNDVGGPMGLGEREQAAKIPRVTMLALAAGIEKVFIYREKGSTPAHHAGAGLVRNDDSLRPSWFTFATLIRQFQGVPTGRSLRLPHPDPKVWLYAWPGNDGLLLTAWAIEGETNLGMDLGACTVVDAYGHERREASGATVRLGEFPVYIREIADATLIDALLEKAREIEAARLSARRRAAARRTYLFDFGASDHQGLLDLGRPRRFTQVSAKDSFDAARGYGFEPAGLRDNDAHWIADPVRRDSVRIDAGRKFRFLVEPGTYELTLTATPVGNAEHLTMRLSSGGETTDLTVSAADSRAGSPVTRSVTLSGPDAVLSASAHVDINGLQLVEDA